MSRLEFKRKDHLAAVRRSMAEMVCEYFNAWRKPLPYMILSRRFYAHCAKLGSSLQEQVDMALSDRLFQVNLNERGARECLPPIQAWSDNSGSNKYSGL